VVNDPNQPAVVVRDPARRGTQAPNEQLYPDQRFGGVYQFKSIGNSNYHGLVVAGKYQGRRGLSFQGSYTLGKSIDDHSSFFNAGLGESVTAADNNNRRLERGPSTFDIRHRAVFVYVIDLPVGPGHPFFGRKNGLNRAAFGGWRIAGITTLQTGAPFTVITGGPDSEGFNSGGLPHRGNSDRPGVTPP